MPPANATALRTPRHARNVAARQRPFGTASGSTDPILEDCLLGATAVCAELAADIPTLARAGHISASWASEMRRTGGKGGFLHKTTVLTYGLAKAKSARAWAVLVHLKVTLKQALMPTDREELIARFWELTELEAEVEGRENLEQSRVRRDLEALKRATLAEAAVQEELAAVIEELQRRRIDPFAIRQDA